MSQDATASDGRQLDLIPRIFTTGSLNLLAGASGVGKTALAASLARAFRDGTPIFGHAVNKPPAVGYINGDRSWEHGAGYWLAEAGCSDLLHYSMKDDPQFNPRSLRQGRTVCLTRLIDRLQLPPYSVVFIDPLSMFFGDLNRYEECAQTISEIQYALLPRQLTAMGLMHSVKLKADKRERYLRPQDSILGSAALFGYCDTQCYLASPQETGRPYYAFTLHPHLAPLQTFFLTRDAAGLFIPYDGFDDKNLQALLALIPPDYTEIDRPELAERAEAIPMSLATVKRVLRVLIDRGYVERVRPGIYRRRQLVTH